jgi:hypothetical protein
MAGHVHLAEVNGVLAERAWTPRVEGHQPSFPCALLPSSGSYRLASQLHVRRLSRRRGLTFVVDRETRARQNQAAPRIDASSTELLFAVSPTS